MEDNEDDNHDEHYEDNHDGNHGSNRDGNLDGNDAENLDEQPPQPQVELDSVSMRFGSQQVLRNLTFTVPKGQCLAIIGESGCGKTVLLKLIIGLLTPSQGLVSFDGTVLQSCSEQQLTDLRTKYGFVFQMAALFDSMTIEENIGFPLVQHRNLPSSELHNQVSLLIHEVGLPESVLKKKPAELSGGMRKRVGLARALTLAPELILYDEPTTGLDPIMTAVINELIYKTNNKHKTRDNHRATSIIVTHDMSTVYKCADRVIMLFPLSRLEPDQPQIIYDGKPGQMKYSSDPRVRQFINAEAGERINETWIE